MHVSCWPKVIQGSLTRVKVLKAMSFSRWKFNPDVQHIKISVSKSASTVNGHTLTGVVTAVTHSQQCTVDHSDEKRVQMGQKSSSLRKLGKWRIIRSALRRFTTIIYVSLFKFVHIDQSDEKRCQNISTLGNPVNIASVSS